MLLQTMCLLILTRSQLWQAWGRHGFTLAEKNNDHLSEEGCLAISLGVITLVSLLSVGNLNQITNRSLIFPRVRQVVQTPCWHQLGWTLWRCRALDTKNVVDMCSLLSPLHMDFVYFCRRPKLWRDTYKLEFKTIILSLSVTELFWETVTTNMHGLEK